MIIMAWPGTTSNLEGHSENGTPMMISRLNGFRILLGLKPDKAPVGEAYRAGMAGCLADQLMFVAARTYFFFFLFALAPLMSTCHFVSKPVANPHKSSTSLTTHSHTLIHTLPLTHSHSLTPTLSLPHSHTPPRASSRRRASPVKPGPSQPQHTTFAPRCEKMHRSKHPARPRSSAWFFISAGRTCFVYFLLSSAWKASRSTSKAGQPVSQAGNYQSVSQSVSQPSSQSASLRTASDASVPRLSRNRIREPSLTSHPFPSPLIIYTLSLTHTPATTNKHNNRVSLDIKKQKTKNRTWVVSYPANQRPRQLAQSPLLSPSPPSGLPLISDVLSLARSASPPPHVPTPLTQTCTAARAWHPAGRKSTA
jgi:hypothetical protein